MLARIAIVLAAAGCLWAFGYLWYRVVREWGRWGFVVPGVAFLGIGWCLAVSLLWLFRSEMTNVAGAIVVVSIGLGLPSVPMAIVAAVLAARTRNRDRLAAREHRATTAVRRWREKGPAANDGSGPA